MPCSLDNIQPPLLIVFAAIQGFLKLLGSIQCVALTPVCIVKGLINFVVVTNALLVLWRYQL